MAIALGRYLLLPLWAVQRRTKSAPQPDPWQDDPLSHPDIQRMTLAQLADLPSPTPLNRRQTSRPSRSGH